MGNRIMTATIVLVSVATLISSYRRTRVKVLQSDAEKVRYLNSSSVMRQNLFFGKRPIMYITRYSYQSGPLDEKEEEEEEFELLVSHDGDNAHIVDMANLPQDHFARPFVLRIKRRKDQTGTSALILTHPILTNAGPSGRYKYSQLANRRPSLPHSPPSMRHGPSQGGHVRRRRLWPTKRPNGSSNSSATGVKRKYSATP
ncbi:hypothetical protein HDE_11835 [Halotydeus destructor]|nr:hypothetical protein HDE_11835 [Halotydeus destructor]